MADPMAEWGNFFVAVAGAAAALAGLLFVAVSINLSRILASPHLPIRAVSTLVAFLSTLAVSLVALVPRQSTRSYGLEIGVVGLLLLAIQTRILLLTRRGRHPSDRYAWRVAWSELPSLAFLAAGAQLWRGDPHGVYLVVPGILLSFAAGIFGAWVLLIEIQR